MGALNMKLAIEGGKPVTSRKFPDPYPLIGKEEEKAVLSVLKSRKLSGYPGPKILEFEKKFAEYHGVKHAIATNCGTSALVLALYASGIGFGDEVILPPYTFIASASSILQCNAVPVFSDIDYETMTIDPSKVEEKITSRTKAIMPVHLYGHPADMDPLIEIAKRHNILIIEDCAQAHSAQYKGKLVGTLGDAGCFSFQISKNMMTAEGGMIITDRDDIAEKAKMLRHQGSSDRGIVQMGLRVDMTEMQAAIGIVQLRKLERFTRKRISNAAYLSRNLQGIPGIKPPRVPSYIKHVYHIYVWKIDEEELGVSKEQFVKALRAEGIPANPIYGRPLYEEPIFKEQIGRGQGFPYKYLEKTSLAFSECPNAERVCRTAVGVYLSPAYGVHELNLIVMAVRKVAETYASKK
ncbi:MAG: DegT/DnrJ/EryC1/StrS family aminotransferase [Thermoproteota archaeon]